MVTLTRPGDVWIDAERSDPAGHGLPPLLAPGSDPVADEVAAATRTFAETTVLAARDEGEAAQSYPPGLMQAMADQGLFRLRLPTEHGGAGYRSVVVGRVLEELARVDLSVCFPVLNAALVGSVLADNGTPEQVARWLPLIGDGAVCALALTEPDHGTDAAAIESTARTDGDGWLITGRKASIMAAVHASHGLVFARTSDAGARGISAFFTSLRDGDGLERDQQSDLGCRAGGRGTLDFRDYAVDGSDLVGAPGSGFVEVMRGFGVSRAYIALMAVSVGQAALDAALEHARLRTAFGHPLSSFQAVAFPLVEHATVLRAARAMAYEALEIADRGGDPRVPANMVKWWAPKAAAEATQQALLTMGQAGWTEDGPIAKRLRDVIGLQLADGTAAATKLVVARAMLGREHAP